MTDEPETEIGAEEYVAAFVANTKAVLDAIDVVKDKWIETLTTDRDYSDAIAGAEAMRTEIITGSYPQIITLLFSQPAATDPPEVQATTLADLTSGSRTRAGRGSQ